MLLARDLGYMRPAPSQSSPRVRRTNAKAALLPRANFRGRGIVVIISDLNRKPDLRGGRGSLRDDKDTRPRDELQGGGGEAPDTEEIGVSKPQRRGARTTETRKPLLDVVAVQPFSSFSAVSRRFLALTFVFFRLC